LPGQKINIKFVAYGIVVSSLELLNSIILFSPAQFGVTGTGGSEKAEKGDVNLRQI